MAEETPVAASVSVPSKHPLLDTRKGKGFSLSELKEAKLSKVAVKLLKIRVDTRRGTSYPENVAALKKMKVPERKKKAKKPKKSKVVKPKQKKVKPAAGEGTESDAGKKPAKKAAKKASKAAAKPKGPGLEALPKITPELVTKIADLGIDDMKKLSGENSKEMSKLLGVDDKLVKEWIAFAKENAK